nr:E3 ubiquitin-protein ligase makorin-1-like [Nerophis lumbriciformis]
MDRSYPNGGICRHYLNGSCRYGSRCHYRHELPTTQPPQICRYFQKGACWYGERCRWYKYYWSKNACTSSLALHIFLLILLCNLFLHIHSSASRVSVKSSESVCAGACDKEVSLPGGTEAAGASAAALCTEETEAIFQSRDVICGICMDKVYEKIDRRNRVFGILPNCTHAFCLECIMTWRKTRNLGSDVVKTCPQCRVRSAFYVPSKYWVEGQAKERLIADFKEKFSKRSCSYYAQYKYCPFEADCLYRHVRSARRRSFLDDDDDEEEDEDYDGLLNFFIAMTLLHSDEDDDDDNDKYIPFLLAEYGF